MSCCHLYLVCFDKYIVNHVCILSWFFVNGPQALYINPGCLKCTTGINLSPANKNLLTISVILYS